ncbi:MAG TPA: cyanophycin synthetase, partial [Candidatus Thermoplasmatota archaeon]|nr:cyanophycin synthetase [Candidatus Thermoplasmatota archaeon]
MYIVELRSLPGPNLYSRAPSVFLLLDPETDGEQATPELVQRLLQALPGVHGHTCDQAATFAASLAVGTSLAHVVEHVAVELQRLVEYEVGHGSTRKRGEGLFAISFPYREASAGMEAARRAADILEDLLDGRQPDVAGAMKEINRAAARTELGPTTSSLVAEAERRGIPHIRLDDASYLQFGYGCRLQRMQASMTGRTSCIGAEIADDKERTKEILHDAGVPVPLGEVVGTVEDAIRAAERLGYPVVLKPLVGNHGRGITTDIASAGEIPAAFEVARQVHHYIVVEQHIRGDDYRVLVINGKFVAAARRDPAHVIGDGTSTIQQLIDATNADPRRAEGHENVLTRIRIDEPTLQLLAKHGMTLQTVPAAGERVVLKGTANMSTGGTATDVTDEVHEDVRTACERAARMVGLDIMGLDIVASSIAEPFEESRGAIVEVNAAPGLRMHVQPTFGRPRDVTGPIFDMLFPDGSRGRIPIVCITGTNGKTTTVRLTAHLLATAGHSVGIATTSGVEIKGAVVRRGDYSGPEGAHVVLKDPAVTTAVLEVARGGILRRGLGFDQATVGVFLNVSSDHLGEGGIDTLEDLARLKGVVIENVAPDGTAVLNADDPLVLQQASRTSAKAILFSLHPESETVRRHIESGGTCVLFEDKAIVLRRKEGDERVAGIDAVPITLGGAAIFNVANALAAVAAAHAVGLSSAQIRDGLASFRPTPEQLPGRMNVLEFPNFRVIVDYGHNAAAVTALANVVRTLPAKRRITVASASGNRRDADILDFGRQLAQMYDHFVLCDPDPRGREAGETMRKLGEGVLAGGRPQAAIEYVPDEEEAIERALALAQEGDLLVVQADDVRAAAPPAEAGARRPLRSSGPRRATCGVACGSATVR